jgi:hypothetical protein
LASYQASLAIRERLTNSDPGNAQWQRDLAVSYAKLANANALTGASRLRPVALAKNRPKRGGKAQ